MPVYENERGTYIFNSRDLCMIEHIPEMIDAGIDSFKIEGRMKTALYVATVARAYRKAIDDYRENPEIFAQNLEWYKEEIGKCTNREFTTGFFFGKPGSDAQIYKSSTYVKNYTYLGTIEEVDERGYGRLEQKNKFSEGDRIEIMKPSGENVETIVEEMYNGEGEAVESCPHAKQVIWLKLSEEAQAYDLLRAKAASCESAGA